MYIKCRNCHTKLTSSVRQTKVRHDIKYDNLINKYKIVSNDKKLLYVVHIKNVVMIHLTDLDKGCCSYDGLDIVCFTCKTKVGDGYDDCWQQREIIIDKKLTYI